MFMSLDITYVCFYLALNTSPPPCFSFLSLCEGLGKERKEKEGGGGGFN
jgi:hypothetical protein